MAQPIPQEWSHLVALNVEYSILICVGEKCKYALKPTAISRHLGDKHKTPIELRKQVEQYVKGFPFAYSHIDVPLPVDGLAPQPIIPVVDGFVCWDCPFKTQSRATIRQHANQAHNKKRVADEELCRSARLQSWFGGKRERYWVVDESKQDEQVHQVRRRTVQDVGEESNESEAHSNDELDSNNDSQEEINDQIVQDIEKWKTEAQERRLTLLKKVPVVEMDSWLQYTKWNEVLSTSQHNMVKTFQFTREPDADESELRRLLHAWRRILERSLDTLAATDHKDALKWWASPKNEAASQRPFELPQNAKSVEKYSGYWESMICYIMRTAPIEGWEDETGEYIF
jgi:hypothetical protein